VIFVKGLRSGLAAAGTAGGMMGHVMLVLAPPVRISAHSEEAEWLEDVWPKDGANEIWRIRTAESARKRQGLYEAEVLLHVAVDSGSLTLIGEVLGESVLTSGEEVELWQSPVDLRMRLDAELVREVLSEMRGGATNWSWATAARAIFASAAGGSRGSGIGSGVRAQGSAAGVVPDNGGSPFGEDARTDSSEGKAKLLREITRSWASDPICTSVVISFWQRALCKFSEGVRRVQHTPVEVPSPSAADLILRWMPLWADRSLPHALSKTMQTCGWRIAVFTTRM
jgi:hypothetical protein